MLKLNYLKWVLGTKRTDDQFHFITSLIFILGIFNVYYKFDWTDGGLVSAFNLWNPSWLLFGPLLFCAYRFLTGRPVKISWKHVWHLLPFLIVNVCYIYVLLTTNMQNPWQSTAFTWYQNSYFLIVLSLLPYSLYVASRIILINTKNGANADALIISIASVFVLISVIISMMIIGWGIISIDMGIDYRYFSYGLLLFVDALIVCYWVSAYIQRKKEKTTMLGDDVPKSYKHSTLTKDLALIYKQRIIEYFESSQIYLTPNLSLEFLTKELNIPKHHFSQVFNIYFEKSFHHFIADYRISHALELLDMNNGRLTIESLAYSCGFNSKTTLNRYFKEKTGLTPSEYQFQLGAQCA